jgi:hypothetical protein
MKFNRNVRDVRVSSLSRREWYLWTAATILLVADVMTTWYAVASFGVFVESNPLIRFLLSNFGISGLVFSKIPVFVFGFVFREFSTHRWLIPSGVVVIMIPVVLINTLFILSIAL